MSIRVTSAVAALALLWLAPTAAHAFSDPAQFAAPALLGGGAGRYFTGSPGDGHGCSVCHSGGLAPSVYFEGFPAVLEPATRYDVKVRWDLPEVSHALHLELTDMAGRHPSVELTNADALPPEERCEGEPDGAPGVQATDIGERRVLGVQDCGARSLAFSFVAPEGPLFFAFGAVRSDSSGTPEGDGVLEHRSTIGGEPAASCAFQAPARGGTAWTIGLGALLLAIVCRHRTPPPRRRKRLP